MAITAAMVKELRESTGAGMMECKKALTETNGDMDAAVEFLRKNGIMKAEKKASRIAAEGLTKIAVKDDKTAAVVEVNSETDFVAQNEKFQAFVEAVATQAVNSDSKDLDSFMAEKWNEDASKTVNDALVEITAVISEKLSIRRFEKVVASNGIVVPYVHGNGRISVIVEADTDVVNDEIKDAVKNIAMQVAALNPKYVATEDVSQEYRDHEKEILLAQAMKENEELPEGKRKPQEIIEKMLIGRLNKELKEICLNEQVYVKAEDGKQTVGQYVAQVAKNNGANLKIKRFVRFETGEGIEKKSENFAEEVAKQAAGLN
ncbi:MULTISPECIES: translation elongation factor Ts [unclassified Butyrivibrio]|uniref:translation elongation factor Ts n=1 Tax=unclassified Butyrivibrio TaxID=2639466 RepID=UPI0008DFCB7E|nr:MULTISPECIES: translation elongation factor Ts [unclassified Butyrivibrio]RKM58924.1 elongation factor Ts [Butyrivibrio sp. XB500-5]SFU40364.1 elongation factor Ts [Butyrivibrio sp. INlla21]